MITYRTNSARLRAVPNANPQPSPVNIGRVPVGRVSIRPVVSPSIPQASAGGNDGGDVIYGARGIAVFLFGDASNRARRRVFHLWSYYRDRKEKAGFFKLKGALCLSKAQWKAFHGL